MTLETPYRIEPCRIEQYSEELFETITSVVAKATALSTRLHPHTAQSLAELVRVMNCYYSNLIEGHNTRPKDIERSLLGDLEDGERRNLQLEARAHIGAQRAIDEQFADGHMPEPASVSFVRWLHREFYRDAPGELLRIESPQKSYTMIPGEFRSDPAQDNVVGRHHPPSSTEVARFMDYFEGRFRIEGLGQAGRIVATAIAHHRFNYIHPFPDGNGRVSRLLSHAMLLKADVGAHGLWSISRGLARGLVDRSEYKSHMDAADAPRRGDLDGRGNLSLRALEDFVLWFCRIALDQLTFMGELFDLERLTDRYSKYLQPHFDLRPEAVTLLQTLLLRGELPRGVVPTITGLKERTARSLIAELDRHGLIGSSSPKGPLSLRFSVSSADSLFPRLFSNVE